MLAVIGHSRTEDSSLLCLLGLVHLCLFGDLLTLHHHLELEGVLGVVRWRHP